MKQSRSVPQVLGASKPKTPSATRQCSVAVQQESSEDFRTICKADLLTYRLRRNGQQLEQLGLLVEGHSSCVQGLTTNVKVLAKNQFYLLNYLKISSRQ